MNYLSALAPSKKEDPISDEKMKERLKNKKFQDNISMGLGLLGLGPLGDAISDFHKWYKNNYEPAKKETK
ncbi:MAG: hypothetical protein WC511_02645 [Candidatus Pacearchaeota archaeon]